MKISELISQYLLSKESKTELDQLQSWKDDTSKSIEVIKELDTVWIGSKEIEDYQVYDTDQAWNSLEKKIDGNSVAEPNNKSRLLFAACAILLVGLSYWMIQLNSGGDTVTESTHFAAVDKVESIQLTDNSRIWLNTNSELERLSDFTTERKVFLNGQAYFDIERDVTRKFIITTQKETVTVLGTAFDLNTYNGTFDLKVTEGLVAVNTGSRVIEVSANQRLVRNNGDYGVLAFDSNDLSWRFENLSFDNTPMTDVLSALSQTYQISFENSKSLDLNNCLINTKFEDESLEDILDELSIISSLKVKKISHNKYQIISLNCK